MPRARASESSGVMRSRVPQSVSGRPPSSEATTRQPECCASIETMPKVSCQYWLLDGITTTSCSAMSEAMSTGDVRASTRRMRGWVRSMRSMMRPCGLSAPAVVTVNVSDGSWSMRSVWSIDRRV